MKTERAPAFQFYAKDWRDVKVRRMTLAAQGAYIAILADMWIDSQDQCSILNHHPFLARALGVSLDEFEIIWKEIQTESETLFQELDGRIYSRRLEQEAMKMRKFSKEQKKRASKRWDKTAIPKECRSDASAIPEPCSSSSSSSSLVVEQQDSITVDEILVRWNEIRGVKTCRKVTGDLLTRVNHLRKVKPLLWWHDLFISIGHSKFLTGGVPARRPGDRPFQASLSWVVGPKNLSKIEAGDYADSTDVLIASIPSSPCQARIQDGRFLRPCGKPSVTGNANTARCDECSRQVKIAQPEPNAAILEGVVK